MRRTTPVLITSYQECTDPGGHSWQDGVCKHCGLGGGAATDARKKK